MLMSRAAALGFCTLAATALAQEETPEFHHQPARLSLRVDAMAWYMGPGGDLDMPSTDALGDPDPFTISGLGFDTPRFTAAPEFHIMWDDQWRVTLRGYYFSDDHDAVVDEDGRIGRVGFQAGDSLHSAFTFGSYEAEVGYKWFDFAQRHAKALDSNFLGTVEVVGGVRAFQVGWSVDRTTGTPMPGDASQQVDESFAQLLAGVRLKERFGQTAGLDAQINIAMLPMGDGSNVSGDVIVGGWWYPWPNVGVQIGYRAAYFSLGTGTGAEQFDFTGWNQGLQIGLVMEF